MPSYERKENLRLKTDKGDGNILRPPRVLQAIASYRQLETFPRVFCFPNLRINENGGKLLQVFQVKCQKQKNMSKT